MGRLDEESFESFVTGAQPGLHRLARAWCRDAHRADDLVQGALERVFAAWPRVRKDGNPFGYARTTMVRLLISEERRPWRRREVLAGDHGDDVADVDADRGLRLDLLDALRSLPARQRAVVLLRFVEDLPVSEVADVLGCSEGTVKSQSHRAMASLRRHPSLVSEGAPR